MTDDSKNRLRLEIAHVLFIDIVGYSKLLTDEQSEALHELNRVVRNTDTGREAEAADQLTILPTGDGMALVFTGSVEEPVECALEISQALRVQPGLPVRMGIHSGPVHQVKDANGRENVAGAGINIAQRVMDCGDAGHILASKRVADDLAQYRRWQPYLHELGDVEVKHGVVVSLVNLYAETIGNPVPPARLGKGSILARSKSRPHKGWSPLIWAILILGGLLLVLAIVSLIFAPALMRSVSKPAATAAATTPPPSGLESPSLADTIKNEVTQKITQELQQDLTLQNKPIPKPPPVISAISKKSIAVLPFVNMSADKNDEYLSDGMTEELINALARVPGLRVPGRTSCFAFKGKNDEEIFRKVGQELHVGTVLEGSVRKAGEKLRVTAQLVNVADGYHLWSEDYDGDMSDILRFESNVAKNVVAALQVRLDLSETEALGKKPTENTEAYRFYLLGKYEIAKFSRSGWNNAIKDFERALEIDPQFALAYSGLADTYGLMGGEVMPGREAWDKTKQFAKKALELDPNLAEAHLSSAVGLAGSFEWKNAQTELDRALALNPNLTYRYDAQAWIFTAFGRFDEAIAKEKKALELDPLNPFFQNGLGWYLYNARRYDEAIAQFHRALEMDPTGASNHNMLGFTYAAKHDLPDAITEFEQAKQLDDLADYDGSIAYYYGLSGQREKAQQLIEHLKQTSIDQYVPASALQKAYLGLGDKAKALDWLEKSCDNQETICSWLKVDPIYDPLRNEPRFQALIKKVRLQ